MPVRHVFVYGTLRSGEERDIMKLSPAPHLVGRATVNGQLYDLGSYPGVVLGGESQVKGEVYAISADLERLLDEIEEVWPEPNGEYEKRETIVQLDTKTQGGSGAAGVEMSCLVYEATLLAIRGRVPIASGDWVAFRKGLGPAG